MSVKFHINPTTGTAGRCAAKTNCPFGIPLTDHFSSESEGRSAYESLMNRATVRSFKSLKKTYTAPSLESYIDPELLRNMIDQRYVLQSRHLDDDSLSVLCYSSAAQYDAKWNDATKRARGLVVRSSSDDLSDAVIVERPWEKFFTLSQIESGWSLGDEENAGAADNVMSLIDFDAPAEVTDKMDGSMGVLYRDPKGRPAFTTKGSFKSEQALDYTNMMRKNDKMHEAVDGLLTNNPDTTFVFEMVGNSDHQIVLDYGKEDISLLGAINKSTGLYLSTKDFDSQWKDKGLTTAELMPAATLGEALSLSDREEREGVVVRMISDDPNKQMQIKIKQSDYLELHKSRTQFSKKESRNVMRNTPSTIGDFIKVATSKDVTHFPTIAKDLEIDTNAGRQAMDINARRREYYESVVLAKAQSIYEAKNIVDSLPDSEFEGKEAMKNFAKKAGDFGADTGLLFTFFNARVRGMNIEDRDATKEMRKAAQNG